MRRTDRERDAEFARKLFAGAEYVVIATADASGRPYAIPVSAVLEGDAAYIHCAAEGMKLDNIRTNSAVCLTCVGKTRLVPGQFTIEYESAVAFGTAAMVIDDREKRHALQAIARKYAFGYDLEAESRIERSLDLVAIVRIDISRMTAKAATHKEPNPAVMRKAKPERDEETKGEKNTP